MEKLTDRASNIELVRIIAIFGIIVMHTLGGVAVTEMGTTLIFKILVSSIFNMGVSLFMLISGYYGVTFSAKKVVRLEVMMLFYGILGVMIGIITEKSFGGSITNLLKVFLPITSRRYWYMSIYVVIMCCSKYLNQAAERLEKEELKKLLLILLFFFYVLPSFGYFEIMNDGGKGIVNMLVVYLSGRYIKLYHNDKKIPQKLFLYGMVIIAIGFTGNCILTTLLGRYFCPFARDNSIIIYMGSICFFLAFKNIKIQSKGVNVVAGSVLGVYLFEGAVRKIMNCWIDLLLYKNEYWFSVIVVIYVCVVMCICIIIELFRKK